MSEKKLIVSVRSDTGTVRKNNQDNFYINGKFIENYTQKHITAEGSFDEGVFAVADGMGGESFGDVASDYAVRTLCDFKTEDGGINDENIYDYVDKANNLICDEMRKRGQSIGTTIAIADIKDDTASFYNVGDSKCFLFRSGKVKQMTKDHSVVANLVEMGGITPEQAKTDKLRHQLSQALGVFPEEFIISPFISEPVSLQSNDAVIICSDGLTDALDESMIADIIIRNENPFKVSDELVFSAMQNGSKDNVTVVVIFYKRNDSRQEKVKDVYYENDDTVLLKEDNNPKLYYNNSIHEELDATINLDEKLRNADSPNFTAGNFYNNNTKNESASPHFTENGYNMPQSYGNRKNQVQKLH